MSDLSGLDLRRAVAEALGWRRIEEGQAIPLMGRLPEIPEDGIPRYGPVPAYESDSGTLPELWRWLEGKGMEWEQSVYLKHERKYRAYAWGRRCECREHDATNPVTAVARLVVAVAEWEKGAGK